MKTLGKCLKKNAWKHYKYSGLKSQDKFTNRIFNNIVFRGIMGQKKIPIALDISTLDHDWPYKVKGRFLSVSGMRVDQKRVRLADSYLTPEEAKKAKNKKRGIFRKRSLKNTYSVAKAHMNKAMIW